MDSTHYQRIRLWAGITSIGTNLALIWGFALSASWWASEYSGMVAVSAVLFAVAVLVTLASLPFEILVGYAVEYALGRTFQPFGRWISDWIKGRFFTLTGLWIGMVYFSAINQAPGPGVVALTLAAGVAVILLLLLVPAGYLAPKGTSEAAFEKKMADEFVALGIKWRPIRWFDPGDEETVNGCITPRGFLSLSTTVARWLTPREAALMAAREECYRQSGTWIMILGIVVAWTLLGILLTLLMPSANPVQAGLSGAAVMSSWCFIALFVWPTVNRVWMKNADAFLAILTSSGEARDLLSKIERLNATDISLSPAKTAVFHPIPPLQDRLTNLNRHS